MASPPDPLDLRWLLAHATPGFLEAYRLGWLDCRRSIGVSAAPLDPFAARLEARHRAGLFLEPGTDGKPGNEPPLPTEPPPCDCAGDARRVELQNRARGRRRRSK